MKTIAYYQERIDSTIQALGGYWRPLSSLARLLEELGEVNELLLQEERDKDWKQDLASELTDLFFISTCLAHQYCAILEDEYKKLNCPIIPEEMYAKLRPFESPVQGLLHVTAQSGQIARILNHYEGDKKKKPSEQHRSVATEVASLHISLLRLANTVDVKLFEQLEVIINRNLVRDKNRFDRAYDPVTEDSKFDYLSALQEDGQQSVRKVWGAKDWDHQMSIEENIQRSLPTINRWLKCGLAESIDAVVYKLPSLEQDLEHSNYIQKIMYTIKSKIEADQTELSLDTYVPQSRESVFLLLKRV